MSTKRTTITIPQSLYNVAEDVMAERHFSDFSGFVQSLIREEWERRQSALKLGEHSPPVTKHPLKPHPVDYKGTKNANAPPKRKAG